MTSEGCVQGKCEVMLVYESDTVPVISSLPATQCLPGKAASDLFSGITRCHFCRPFQRR